MPLSEQIPDPEDVIHQGPASTVSRIWAVLGSPSDTNQEPRWVACKSASAYPKFTPEPHDIMKEVRTLSGISHENIISVLGQEYDPPTYVVRYYMPFIPFSLADLLRLPSFSPYASPTTPTTATKFILLTKSIVQQTLSALAYLHAPQRRIAHRDIKPSNILLDANDRVKLIDFGICCSDAELDSSHEDSQDVWPEKRNRMYFEVSTGPYRAPELLFGTRSYDACATDLWSFGATLAEFFTTLRRQDPYTDTIDLRTRSLPFATFDDDEDEDEDVEWTRDSLFVGAQGELGLAWSIFKIRGSPNAQNWPDFQTLPQATRVSFVDVPRIDLCTLLPNLPAETTTAVFPLTAIDRFLIYTPSDRLTATAALEYLSTWFADEPALVKRPMNHEVNGPQSSVELGELVGMYFS